MTSIQTFTRVLVTLGLVAHWGSAFAHVSISPTTAVAGTYTKATLLLPHGCAGSTTTAITVHVPPGFLVAKPMPKPGWQVSTRQARLAKPVLLHGRSIEETTSVIRWEGGRLPSDWFDEFSVFGKLADQSDGSMPFRVVQTCEQGEIDWNGAPGTDTPSPLLQVQPAAPAASPHQHAH